MKKIDIEICPICESEMLMMKKYNYDFNKCKNGCCSYLIDHKKRFIQPILFNGGSKFVIVIDENYKPDEEIADRLKRMEELGRTKEGFLKAVRYWKENDRYLAKIMGVE